jgi:ubiquitin carboxyl-terminal hydrolase L5
MSEWCTIESDPAVFSELVAQIGVKDIEVEEIYSLDSSEQRKEKSYGLIFLFKWRSEVDNRSVLHPSDSPVYFARQIVNNACATQAILSVLLNIDGADLGETLNDFKSFTNEIDSESKGIAIGNSDVLREAHNSFARPEPFLHEESRSSSDGAEAYHFIAYVPCHGGVYE